MTRSGSRSLVRQSSSKPYMRRKSSAGAGSSSSRRSEEGSTGLTKYVGEVNLSFEQDLFQAKGSKRDSVAEAGEREAGDEVAELGAPLSRSRTLTGKALSILPKGSKKRLTASGPVAENEEMAQDESDELTTRSVSTFGRALSSFRQGKPSAPKEIDLWKPDADAILGITFEVPADESLKGVVVAQIHAGYLMARSKKLRIGDVIHAVNGRPVATPQEGATLLREATGVIQLVVSRVNAKPKDSEGDPKDASKDDGKDMRTRSFLPMSIRGRPPSGKAKKEDEPEAANNTTVVVSCSQLILESKKIVGETAGLDDTLDELYRQLKAKEIASQAALHQLMALVGQTTVEQAGLVIANAHQGTLPEGWVEYFDKETNRCYYYNVHTKTTTWYKPRKDKPPPPPPPGQPPKRRASGGEGRSTSGGSVGSDGGNSTSTGHGVAGAIAAMHSKKKMVETVQLDCTRAPRNGAQGLVSVSL